MVNIKAEMGHWSSVVGHGVLLIDADTGATLGQIAMLCQDDRLREKSVQEEICRKIFGAFAPPAMIRPDQTPERVLLEKIAAELIRARAKFPGKNVTFAELVEEVGELATAPFEESAERVEKEAVQVAVMAMRMILDGDHCFDAWRAEKGLDHLDPAHREEGV